MPIALGTLLVIAGFAVAATWPGFVARSVVVSGNDRVSRDEILTRARVTPHVSIWLQNAGAISRRIQEIPYIDAARVRRIPPSTIRIVVSERKPFVVLRSGDNEALVDRALRVLAPVAGLPAYPVLILAPGATFEPGQFVRRSDAMALRDAYEEMDGRKIAPLSLQYDKFGGLMATLHGGLRLMLGSQVDLARKLTLADAILSQIVNRQRRVAAIDLRAPSAPVLVYR